MNILKTTTLGFALIFCFVVNCTAQTQEPKPLPFIIKGKFDKIEDNTKVILSYRNGRIPVLDSTRIKNGIFEMQGIITEPTQAAMYFIGANDNIIMSQDKLLISDWRNMYIETGIMSINGQDSLGTATIEGGPVQKDYLRLEAQTKPVLAIQKELLKKAFHSKGPISEEVRMESMSQMQMIAGKEYAIQEQFVKDNPTSLVSWNIVIQRFVRNDESYGNLFEGMDVSFKQSEIGKYLAKRIESNKRLAIGKEAVNFVQQDTLGRDISLQSLKGKYVLLDFWASWCAPCRKENPNVVKAYQRFKGKNFEILAVSLDDNKDRWRKAIKDDGLTWLHVSDLKGWGNEVAATYGITSIPQNLLLDPNGVIIAKNLRGEDVEKKLSEIFGQ